LGARGWALLSGAILATGAAAIYAQTLFDPLLFDDRASIDHNPSIQGLWPLGPVLHPPGAAGVGGRPLLNLSYAFNYAFGGEAVLGYHAVNLIIHILAGWTLFALVRRTLRRPCLAPKFGGQASPLALLISALWTWHPVQTESVTYLSQRAESLMGLCYLLTIFCFLRGADTGRPAARRGWFGAAALACLAGMATKEVMVTAPLAVLLYDRALVSDGFRAAWRRHWPLYLLLAATWIPLGFLLHGLHRRAVGFQEGIAWWSYALVECRAVVTYMRLAVWPRPLIFDYGMYAPLPLAAAWPFALGLLALLILAALLWRRSAAAGFAAAWFFLILAPTSSVVPIALQPLAENRLYLPLAGVIALAVLGGFAAAGRRILPVCALAALGLGWAAAVRNRAYATPLTLWEDTVAKVPASPRAHNNLGFELHDQPGRSADAVAEYEAALRLKPDYADAHNNLGFVWQQTPGQLDAAIREYQAAIRAAPDHAEFYYNLGNALSAEGRTPEAIAQYEQALRLNPDFAEAHSNLGFALEHTDGRIGDAIAHYRAAVTLQPETAALHFNLASALLKTPGRSAQAQAQLEAGLRLQPDNALARQILAQLRAATP